MRAIMLMFDTLNRRMLPNYGCDWTHCPNFRRLAERTVTFDRAYVGSMPCMPARRELHTGRYNFLHRSWGPLEPFDDSMPQILHEAGLSSHLYTDHYHYFEDGGATYHNRYSTYESMRGQEGDRWFADKRITEVPDSLNAQYLPGIEPWRQAWGLQDWVNRQQFGNEADYPQAKTIQAGCDFLRRHADCQDWFLQIETFDPHEPFVVPERYRALFPQDYDGPLFDWPPYGPVDPTATDQTAIDHCRYQYAALLAMCDHHLGRVLDLMDELDLWQDTMLIVNTDHGFLLGEHERWAKCWCPWYQEQAHIPLFIWDPQSGVTDQRRQALVQTIDLPATLLDFFQVPAPPDMLGRSLLRTIVDDTPVRETALFGIHGGHVNITDGRYVYMRGSATASNQPLAEYTLMPTHMRTPFAPAEFAGTSLHPGFPFTKGAPVMRIPSQREEPCTTMLFDIECDPQQRETIDDPAVEEALCRHLVAQLAANEAPEEQYQRLGLAQP